MKKLTSKLSWLTALIVAGGLLLPVHAQVNTGGGGGNANGKFPSGCTAGQVPAYVSGTTWQCANNGAGGGAPNTGHFLTTINETASMANSINLGALSSGLMLNTVTTGTAAISAYGGSSCTNQLARSISGIGAFTCDNVQTADIAAAAVTLVKMANLANGTIICRTSVGTGVPEACTTLPTAAFPALTGNVTTSAGSLATTIANSVITNAMIVNGTIAAAKLVGTDITTLGTIGTGTWQGSVIGFAYGGTGLSTAADDTVMVSTGSAWVAKILPDCPDTGGNHLNYQQSVNTFSCGTSGGGATASALVTHASDPGSPSEGWIYENTTDHSVRVYNGTAWTVQPAIPTPGGDCVVTYLSTVWACTSPVAVAQGGTGAQTLTGILKGNGTSAFTTLTAPSGTIVGTTDAQALTNKTIDAEATGNVISIPWEWAFEPAVCQGGTNAFVAGSYLSGLGLTAICANGTNIPQGVAEFPDSDGAFHFSDTRHLPHDWTNTNGMDVRGTVRFNSDTNTGHIFRLQVQWACTAGGATPNDTWSTAVNIDISPDGTVAHEVAYNSTGISVTGCSADNRIAIRLMRDRTNVTDTVTGTVDLFPFTITIRRAM